MQKFLIVVVIVVLLAACQAVPGNLVPKGHEVVTIVPSMISDTLPWVPVEGSAEISNGTLTYSGETYSVEGYGDCTGVNENFEQIDKKKVDLSICSGASTTE